METDLFLPVLSTLTPEEKQIALEILDEDTRIDVVVPLSSEEETLVKQIDALCKIHGRVERISQKVKPLIGRLLVVLQDKPEAWRGMGYRSFDEFMSVGLERRYGISRSEAYEIKKVASNLKCLSVAEMQEIPQKRLRKLAAITNDEDPNFGKIFEVVKDKSKSSKQIEEEVAKIKGYDDGSSVRLVYVNMAVTEDTYRRWNYFWRSNEVQALLSSGIEGVSEGAVFNALLDECELEWRARGNRIVESGRAPINISEFEDVE